MADTSPSLVRLRGVSKRYGQRLVVDGVDLAVPPGERFALLGHNGAGKTTLFKLMLGLCRPTEGEIEIRGKPGADARHESASIGFLPESVSFHDNMSGREVIRFYARLKRRTAAECEVLLERVGLAGAAAHRVRTYSKGMRQRLGLAQAMLGDPPLMLLDEPTTGLDPALRSLFYEIIEQRAAAGATALISSHALSEIENSVDRLAIMKQGRLVACGTLGELRRQAGLPATVRVRVPAGATKAVAEHLRSTAEIRRVNEHTVDVECTDGQKIEVLRRLGDLNKPVLDVDIAPVGLERLYEHFNIRHEESP